MNRPSQTIPINAGSVLHLLQPLHCSSLDQPAIETLAHSIMPYLQRSHLPLGDAVSRISSYYLQDGARVAKLMADPYDPEWQAVLTHVLAFATKHVLYPDDIDATSWPDLDAYHDIQVKLPSYNFEGSLDSWVTVTILNRLRRFWRDRQALSAGGPGFKYKAAHGTAPVSVDLPVTSKVYQFSLDLIADDEWLAAESLSAVQISVGHCVEDAEVQRLVAEVVHDFAMQKQDEQLQHIWHSVIEDQLKLREASVHFGLTISQIHRRIEQVRAHLRQDPRVTQWFKSTE